MKFKFLLLLTVLFCSAHSFAQVPKAKTNYHPQVLVKKMPPKLDPQKNTPPPAPTDLQKAVVNIVVGDDGKDYDTKLGVELRDGNKRNAAYFGSVFTNTGEIVVTNIGEFLPGDNETLPMKLNASVPTGATKPGFANLPMPITREANLVDFQNNNGGTLEIWIQPNGHDTWKINSLSVTLYFNNDPASPHKMTWNNITLKENSRDRMFEFDKDFNPIQ